MARLAMAFFLLMSGLCLVAAQDHLENFNGTWSFDYKTVGRQFDEEIHPGPSHLSPSDARTHSYSKLMSSLAINDGGVVRISFNSGETISGVVDIRPAVNPDKPMRMRLQVIGFDDPILIYLDRNESAGYSFSYRLHWYQPGFDYTPDALWLFGDLVSSD